MLNSALDVRSAMPLSMPAISTPSLGFVRSLLVAVAIELLLFLLAAVVMLQARTVTDIQADKPIELIFDEPKPIVEIAKPKIEPKPEVKPIERPAPVKIKLAPPAPQIEKPQPVVNMPVAESPIVEAVIPPAPPPIPTRTDDTAQKEANFAAQLRAAIQAAVLYPAAARNMGFQGKARVEFAFRDGTASQVRIIQSSGSSMIDRAAIAAVANARVPPLPESLKGKNMLYQVTVVFGLNESR